MHAQTSLYYIRCRVEDAGPFALWWRPNGQGYTSDLDKAGTYTLDEVRRRTHRDSAVPVEVANANTVRVVPLSPTVLAAQIPE